MKLTPQDIEQINLRGSTVHDIHEQIERLQEGPKPLQAMIISPERFYIHTYSPNDDHKYASLFQSLAQSGLVGHFVPAHDLATSLFKSLRKAKDANYQTIEELGKACDEGALSLVPAGRTLFSIRDLAVWPHILKIDPTLEDCDLLQNLPRVLAVIFDELKLDQQPIGLIPFHPVEDPNIPRPNAFDFIKHLAEGGSLPQPTKTHTPMAEHLEEAKAMVPTDAPIQVHFTIPKESKAEFEAELSNHLTNWSDHDRDRCTVTFSTPDSSTDCVALNKDGELARTQNRELLFFPGGHGSVRSSLAQNGYPITLIKRIDSVVTKRFQNEIVLWRQRLVIYALQLELQRQEYLQKWDESREFMAARDWFWEVFCIAISDLDRIGEFLRRPIRVCGIIKGDMHTEDAPAYLRYFEDGSFQIVNRVLLGEKYQNSEDREIYVHPVDMVCVLGEYRGKSDALDPFSDMERWIHTEKIHENHILRTLERPGLWNGGMAKWNTAFMELPIHTFNPVNELVDLTNPGHTQ